MLRVCDKNDPIGTGRNEHVGSGSGDSGVHEPGYIKRSQGEPQWGFEVERRFSLGQDGHLSGKGIGFHVIGEAQVAVEVGGALGGLHGPPLQASHLLRAAGAPGPTPLVAAAVVAAIGPTAVPEPRTSATTLGVLGARAHTFMQLTLSKSALMCPYNVFLESASKSKSLHEAESPV